MTFGLVKRPRHFAPELRIERLATPKIVERFAIATEPEKNFTADEPAYRLIV